MSDHLLLGRNSDECHPAFCIIKEQSLISISVQLRITVSVGSCTGGKRPLFYLG